MDEQEYDSDLWAAEPDYEVLAGFIQEKCDYYWERLRATGRQDLYYRALQLYYGYDNDGSYARSAMITYSGKQGEHVRLRANLFRTYLEHLVVLTVPERPAFNCKSRTYDPESLEAAHLGKSILEYDMAEKKGEDLIYRMAEFQRLFGEGWGYVGWDNSEGVTGDLCKRAYDPSQIIRDPHVNWEDHRWFIVYGRINRWEACAKYPNFHEEIIQAPSGYAAEPRMMDSFVKDQSDDEVVFKLLLYKDTPELPGGRKVLVIGDTVISDSPIEYAHFPLYCMADSPEVEGAWAYSRMWDMMGLDRAYNSMLSTMLTNHDMTGVQNIQVPEGAELDEDDFSGANIWRVPAGEGDIKAVNLTNTSQHTYQGMDLIKSLEQETLGLSGVAQGKGEPGVRSGDHAALLYTAASRINSRQQRHAHKAIEWYGNQVISNYKQFATVAQTVEIVGRKLGPQVVTFVGKDLSPIHRVSVEVVNAQFNSYAHRFEMIKELVKLANTPNGPKITADMVMDFVSTGKLAFEDKYNNQRALIELEREMLEMGEYPKPLVTHDHALHIRSHQSLLDKNPRLAQQNPELVERILAHIVEHLEIWKMASVNQPALLAATGQSLAPLPQGGQPMGAGPEAAPPPGAPAGPPGPGAAGGAGFPPPGAPPPSQGGPDLPPELEGSGVDIPEPPPESGV